MWLSYTFNNLQVTDGCVSPSKYVQVILIMGCIVGCGMCRFAAGFRAKEAMRGPREWSACQRCPACPPRSAKCGELAIDHSPFEISSVVILPTSRAEADKKFAEVEYRSFHHAVAYVLETLPVWVINRFSATRFINNKSVQLQFARNCGLRVPKALMSNSPKGVKDFLDHNRNRTICKSFTPHVWQPQSVGGVAITETFELTRDQLPADEVLTYAPGIYQDMVVKQFDIRTVLMGERVYSYALHNPLKALDWRSDAGMGIIDVEMVPTPSDIERGIVAFAKKSGLCFGSIDFAVDMHENWWFLEINERGQFLWLDQFNPKIKMQEKFCAFITAPEGSTQPLEEREGLFPSFGEYMKIYEEQQAKQEAPGIVAAAASSPYMSQEP